MNDSPREHDRPQEAPPAPRQLAWQPSVGDYQQFNGTSQILLNRDNQQLVNAGVFGNLEIDFGNAPLLAQTQTDKQQGYVAKTPDLDAIDPSQLSPDAQFGGAAGNWFRYLGRAAWHSIDGMTQPDATDRMIFGSAVNAKHYYAVNSLQAVFNDISQVGQGAMHSVWNAPEAFEKMTPEQKSKASAEITFNAFFFMGAKAPIAEEVAEQMGLERMSKAELKALGIESRLPMQLERDQFSIQAKIPGDNVAFFRATMPESGVVDVDSIFKGSLSSGSDFLAQALKLHGTIPSKQLIFSGIVNAETREAFQRGTPAAESLLGRLGARALRELGIEPKSYRYEVVRGKLNLVIDTQ